jgi:hypothetical protein
MLFKNGKDLEFLPQLCASCASVFQIIFVAYRLCGFILLLRLAGAFFVTSRLGG